MGNKRALGRTGIEVAPLAFGGNVFGWTIDEARSLELLDAFVDSGFQLVDTADVYSAWVPGNQGGESETILGKWFQRSGKRDRVILATKVGSLMGPDKKGLSKRYIVQAVEDSLRRLQTDVIDLYQSHRDDEAVNPEETLEAYAQLIQQGKVRAIGASNFTAARLRRLLEASRSLGIPRYETLQPLYNLTDRAAYEADLEPLAREEGIGVIPYYALASGFLTGKYRSEDDLGKSPRGAGVKKYLTERGHAILAALDEVAAGANATPAQVALAWLISRPTVTAPIVSATSVAQWEEIAQAAHLTLSESALARLDAASAETAS